MHRTRSMNNDSSMGTSRRHVGKNSSPRHVDNDASVIDLVDKRIGIHQNAIDAAKTATSVADRHLDKLVDKQSTVMKDMLEDHIRKVAPMTNKSADSSFHDDPDKQKRIVSAAVDNVMKDFNISKKMSPPSYNDRDCYNKHSSSSFSERARMPSGRYPRGGSY